MGMLTRRKEAQRFNSRVALAVSGRLLLYRQQTPSAPKTREMGSFGPVSITGFTGSKPLLSLAFVLPADGRQWRSVPSLKGDSLADSLARGVVRA